MSGPCAHCESPREPESLQALRDRGWWRHAKALTLMIARASWTEILKLLLSWMQKRPAPGAEGALKRDSAARAAAPRAIS